MKAVIVSEPGGAENLKISEVSKPSPSKREILVKVQATALNRADILQREGKYSPAEGVTEILGMEISGVVVGTGGESSKYKIGDRVFGLVPGGSYAEYCLINEEMANPIPQQFTFEQAAAIPEVFLTAFQAITWLAKLKQGETILIHAGASGVGTAAIQIAKEIGAKIFITASKEKHSFCLKLGADKAINYKEENFAEKILSFTDEKGVNVILDFICGPYFTNNINSLSEDGRLIMLATLGGSDVENFDPREILKKRLKIIGSTLRSRDLSYQIKLNNDFMKFAFDKFKSGEIKPIIDKIFDWKDVAEAHRYMEENKNIGKIILKIT